MAEDHKIVDIWVKAHCIPGQDPAEWRWDDEGNLIAFGAYGDRNSPYGWERDHIIPEHLGGPSALWNLRPLWWLANVRKSSAVLPARRSLQPQIEPQPDLLAQALAGTLIRQPVLGRVSQPSLAEASGGGRPAQPAQDSALARLLGGA